MTSTLSDNTLTVPEAAKRLGVSTQTVRRWIRAGRLPAYRVGVKRVRIRTDDLDRVVTPVTAHAEGPIVVGSREEALALEPLSPQEIERRLSVLEWARKRRQEDLDLRGGVPFDSSVEIIREMREERDRQLGYS